jgi:2-methylcitrate dehydratase PrpD
MKGDMDNTKGNEPLLSPLHQTALLDRSEFAPAPSWHPLYHLHHLSVRTVVDLEKKKVVKAKENKKNQGRHTNKSMY